MSEKDYARRGASETGASMSGRAPAGSRPAGFGPSRADPRFGATFGRDESQKTRQIFARADNTKIGV